MTVVIAQNNVENESSNRSTRHPRRPPSWRLRANRFEHVLDKIGHGREYEHDLLSHGLAGDNFNNKSDDKAHGGGAAVDGLGVRGEALGAGVCALVLGGAILLKLRERVLSGNFWALLKIYFHPRSGAGALGEEGRAEGRVSNNFLPIEGGSGGGEGGDEGGGCREGRHFTLKQAKCVLVVNDRACLVQNSILSVQTIVVGP